MSDVENANFRLRPIKELNGYHFFVDDYQRGYKWTAQHVLDLLNDINEFDINQGIYCLQPIITKERLEGEKLIYELIDGQQRMTTIYMILNYIQNLSNLFTITYGTREGSALFLNSVSKIEEASIDENLLSHVEKLETQINSHWEIFEKSHPSLNNVDNYHFFLVYQVIQLWFKKNKEQKFIFRDKLLNQTNIIWYQINADENSEKVFLNINSGKIALTNAELIKALFLIGGKKGANPEKAKFVQNEIAQEWDRMEYSLQNDEFWYFINENPDQDKNTTRIDFLFNLLTRKRKTEKDNFFAYRYYAERHKQGIELGWDLVKDLYERLQEWFEDRTLYHLIGFLISRKISNIQFLLDMNKVNGKKEFTKRIIDLIRHEFKRTKGGKLIYNLDSLGYEESKSEIESILLLFNIETYQISDSNFRFPFDRLKMEKWSIEHIHAQNSKQFTSNKEVVDWAKDCRVLIDDHINMTSEDNEAIKSRMQALENLNVDEELGKETKAELYELSNNLSQYLGTHLISNLALLDRNTNSSIGNDKFLVKRNSILTIDKNGWAEVNGERAKAFIPICTKHVFMKYYTTNIEDIQMSFWGVKDRQDYRAAIEHILIKFLTTQL